MANNVNFQKVLEYFKTLTTIPRGSENREGIRNYLCAFAKQKGLYFRFDDADNVVIIKEAAKGFENSEPVILQGHTDMVCAADEGADIDFLKDALKIKTEGDFIFAEGTSLGGDDGIAVAMMLALLDSDIALPRLECIFTSDEEIGMIGASALDMSDIKGRYLINVDSEDEGVITVSCAGGSTAVAVLPVKKEKITAHIYEVSITGLAGGHSGTEIVKGGLSANKLINKVLDNFDFGTFRVVNISGGEKENAIAARSKITLAFETEIDLNEPLSKLKEACALKEPDIKISSEYKGYNEVSALDEKSSDALKSELALLPQGIIKMSEFDKSAVQTSLNMGVIEQKKERVEFTFSVRSSVTEEREELENVIKEAIESEGGYVQISGVYPAWEYKQSSVLRAKACEVFERLYGYAPKPESIHAGLECGVLISKKPELECISIGPDIFDVHTSREKLSISSCERVWKYLLELLKSLA